MIIRSVRHRGLRRLLAEDDDRFLKLGLASRVRKILTILVLADEMDEFLADAPPGWHVHRLSGKRRKEWSVSVSGNWRITTDDYQRHQSKYDTFPPG